MRGNTDMPIKVQPVTREEYREYCIPNQLDPAMFKLRVEKLGWTREQAAKEPLEAYNKEKIWSKEEMGILLTKASVNKPREILKFLPGRSISEIKKRMSILGLSEGNNQEIISNSDKVIDNSLSISDLDTDTKSVLFGCLFGSGSIIFQTSTDSELSYLTCSDKNQDYNLWKAEMLDTFCPTVIKDGDSSVFRSSRHRIFNQLYAGVYGNFKKERMPLNLISDLGYLGLLVWYLDSGKLKPYGYTNTIGIRRGYMSINVDESVLDSEIDGCVGRINSELGLHLQRRGKEVVFEVESVIKLVPIFEELFIRYGIPSCMLYKLGVNRVEDLRGVEWFGV